jgi:hypothetical protein
MRLRAVSALSILLFLSNAAFAGPYTDDLSKCLVASTTQADRVALARWIFISFAAHPSVAPISSVKPADIESANAEIGSLFMKLLTDSCREKTKMAIKYEGPAAIQFSFQTLGQVAGMELASNASVQARMWAFQSTSMKARLRNWQRNRKLKPPTSGPRAISVQLR